MPYHAVLSHKGWREPEPRLQTFVSRGCGANSLALMKRAFQVVGVLLAGLFTLLISPLLIVVWLLRVFHGAVLTAAWWGRHGRAGRDFLVVYSDSPKWAAFFAETVVPLLENKAVVVNITRDPGWKSSRSLERQAHLYWGGKVEHTPIVIHFRGPSHPEPVRFFEAFRSMRQGDSSRLNAQLARLQELSASCQRTP